MRPLTAASLLLLVAIADVAACGGDSSRAAPAPGTGSTPTGSPSGPDGSGSTPVSLPGAADEGCTVGDAVCTGIARRHACVANATGGGHWTDDTRAAGSGCFGGASTPTRCSDDSALWTGTLLASEALCLRATGSADARARVRTLTETMHLWLNVAGEPGMLVRWAKESATTLPFAIGDLDCAVERVHCGVDHGDKKYDFVGHISRDQCQGVMLGLALAYDALGSADADLRELVRADVVTVVEELMKERTLPLTVTLNGGVPLTSMVTARFMVVSPREMKNGALDLRLDLAKPNDSEMFGFQEFCPNLAQLVRQLPGLGWVPDVNRASSAIMLASFFRVGLKVTEGVPAYAKRRADMLAYYTIHSGEGGSVADWLAVAKQWTDGGSCGSGYFANNFSMMPMYDLARLEDDPARAAVIQNDILGAKMWPAFASTKNSFFSFIYAGTRSGVDAAVVTSAAAQLAQYPAAPRVMGAVDLRSSAKYPTRQQGCVTRGRFSTRAIRRRLPRGLFHGPPARVHRRRHPRYLPRLAVTERM